MSAKWIVVEAAMADTLSEELHDLGVTDESGFITEAALSAEMVQAATWLYMEPPPEGAAVFSLRPPVEAVGQPAEWREYGRQGASAGWNYTRPLVAIRVDA